MNIGIFISPRHSVPSRPDQRELAWDSAHKLADGLVARGHRVVLFAARGSLTRAKLIHFDVDPIDRYWESSSASAYKERVYAAEAQFFQKALPAAADEHLDLLNIHEPTESLVDFAAERSRAIPLVFTLYEPILSNRIEKLTRLSGLQGVHLVSTSQAQRNGYSLPFQATVYSGVDLTAFPMSSAPSEQFMSAGRIVPEKGFEDSIAAVSKSGGQLVLAGKVYQSILGTNSYFREQIEPRMYDTKLTLKQLLAPKDLAALYGSSRAFFYTVRWEEPFAMVMLEALSCGTPVIAYNRGSAPEIIKDGSTGFLVDPDDDARPGKGSWVVKKQGREGLVEAIGRVKDIKREACRASVEERFSTQKMTENYEILFKKLLGAR